MTSLGEKTDGTLNADGSPGLTFSTQWSAAAKLTEFGYSMEIALPFKNLAYDWQKELIMGFKIARLISRKGEEVDYPAVLPIAVHIYRNFRKSN